MCSNITEDLNLSIFIMITGISESKTLTKHIPCERISKFEERNCNSDQLWNNNKCRCDCKKRCVCEKNYVWNRAACSCESGKYLASIMDDSAILCDEVLKSYGEGVEAKSYYETETIPTNFNEKKATCIMQNVYICIFNNYYNIIESCWYLLLSDIEQNKNICYHFTSQITN